MSNFRIYGLPSLQTDESIEKLMVDQMVRKVNALFKKSIASIEQSLKIVLRPIFINSPEYKSIVDGKLMANFGMYPGQGEFLANSVVNKIMESLQIVYSPIRRSGKNVRGGLTIQFVKGDFSDILELPAAKLTVDDGTELPWLEWLTIRGDAIIISGFSIVFGNFNTSRSDMAIMVKSDSGTWRVPPEFSGTAEDNWITRAIFRNYDYIVDTATKIIESSL